MEQTNKANEPRLCYSIYFRNSRQPEYERGKQVVNHWCGTLSEMKMTAHGILAGLCTVGGYKHGHADIYEVSELNEKLIDRVSW